MKKRTLKIFIALLFAFNLTPAIAAKQFKIPTNEIPKITGLGTCEDLAEQTFYCAVMSYNTISNYQYDYECEHAAFIKNNLKYTATREFQKKRIPPTDLKNLWETKTELLPIIKQRCDTVIKNNKNEKTADSNLTNNSSSPKKDDNISDLSKDLEQDMKKAKKGLKNSTKENNSPTDDTTSSQNKNLEQDMENSIKKLTDEYDKKIKALKK